MKPETNRIRLTESEARALLASRGLGTREAALNARVSLRLHSRLPG